MLDETDPLKTNDGDIRQLKSRGLGNLNIVYYVLLYLMISRNYQNNWTNDGRRPSFVLFLNKTLYIRHLFLKTVCHVSDGPPQSELNTTDLVVNLRI